jgi:hypothetical protein
MIRVASAYLYLGFPELSQHVKLPLVGTPAPIFGAPNDLHLTLSVKPQGSHQFDIEQRVNGVVVKEVSLKLSQEGQMINQQNWPGRCWW